MLKVKAVAVFSALAIVLTGCSSGKEILVDRPSPEIEVTPEEFEKEYGFSPSIPESVEEVQYIIDTDTHRGFVGFYEGEVLWNIKVLKNEEFKDIGTPYFYEGTTEIDCFIDSDQDLTVHGVEPQLNCYMNQYSEDNVDYSAVAMWFIEDDGLMITLVSLSDEPVHTMPVEVFDSV